LRARSGPFVQFPFQLEDSTIGNTTIELQHVRRVQHASSIVIAFYIKGRAMSFSPFEDADTAELVASIASAASICGMLSMFETPYKIFKAKTVKDFPIVPQMILLLVSCCWVPYAYFVLHILSSTIMNSCGIGVAIICILVPIIYDKDRRNARRRALLMVAILGCSSIFFALLFGIPVPEAELVTRVCAGITSVMMWCCIVYDMLRACRAPPSDRAERWRKLPILLALSQLVEGTLWTVTGLLKPDELLFGTSLLGLVVAVVQCTALTRELCCSRKTQPEQQSILHTVAEPTDAVEESRFIVTPSSVV
jgi:uncharacterized protein with PQ loop repeat